MAYFNANRKWLEKKGVNVDEWNKASKGLKLPEHTKSKFRKAHAQKALNK